MVCTGVLRLGTVTHKMLRLKTECRSAISTLDLLQHAILAPANQEDSGRMIVRRRV
jgi:hypothetical protein